MSLRQTLPKVSFYMIDKNLLWVISIIWLPVSKLTIAGRLVPTSVTSFLFCFLFLCSTTKLLNLPDLFWFGIQVLKKELDALKDSYSKACESCKAVKKPYDEQSALLNNLKVELSSLDDIRQEAYSQLQDLKQQALEKVRFLHLMNV